MKILSGLPAGPACTKPLIANRLTSTRVLIPFRCIILLLFVLPRAAAPIHKNVLNDYLLKKRCALLFSQISQQVTKPVRIIVSLCGLCLPLWVESRPVCRQSLHCHSAVPQIRRQNIRRCISRYANLNAYPDPTSAHAIAIRIKNCPFAVETGTSNTAASAGDCS
jgi:hypothetical protein